MFRSCITGLHVFTGYPGDDDTPCTPGCCRRHDLCFTNNAILISVYPASQRGRVLGLSTAATLWGCQQDLVAGGFFKPLCGLALFFCSSISCIGSRILESRRHIPNDRQPEDSISFDISGNGLYICAIGMSLYGLSNLSEGIWAWAAFAAGIGAGAGFFCMRREGKQPLIRVEMFREDIAFSFSNLAALLNYGATFCHKLSDEHISAGGNGFHIAGCRPYTDMYAADPGGIFSGHGKLSDKVRPHKIATAGMMICVAALAMFSFYR